MSKLIALVYIGDHYHDASGSLMSPIYTTKGQRFDWGLVKSALRRGDRITIRQATSDELERYDAMFGRLMQGSQS